MTPKSDAQALAYAYAKKRDAIRRRKMWRGGYEDRPRQIGPNKQNDDVELGWNDIPPYQDTSGEPPRYDTADPDDEPGDEDLYFSDVPGALSPKDWAKALKRRRRTNSSL